MRTPEEIKEIIIARAKADSRIRAVLLTGSRANQKIPPDDLQDFDIIYVVHHINDFIADHTWTSVFGEKLIWQLPDEMELSGSVEKQKKYHSFHYLMLFNDGNRIDLTLFPVEEIKMHFIPDSLTLIWLDKDGLFKEIKPATDNDYHIKEPTHKYFLDVCNEFWWVSTYIAKGLARKEILYAKLNMEGPVRKCF